MGIVFIEECLFFIYVFVLDEIFCLMEFLFLFNVELKVIKVWRLRVLRYIFNVVFRVNFLNVLLCGNSVFFELVKKYCNLVIILEMFLMIVDSRGNNFELLLRFSL